MNNGLPTYENKNKVKRLTELISQFITNSE